MKPPTRLRWLSFWIWFLCLYDCPDFMAVMNQNFRCSWDCQQVERYSHGSTITVSWNLIPVIYGRHILSGPTPPSSPPKTNISKQLGHGENNLLRWAMFEVPMPDFSGVICCLLFVYSLKHYPICSILPSGVCQNTAAFRKSRQDCNTIFFAHGRQAAIWFPSRPQVRSRLRCDDSTSTTGCEPSQLTHVDQAQFPTLFRGAALTHSIWNSGGNHPIPSGNLT